MKKCAWLFVLGLFIAPIAVSAATIFVSQSSPANGPGTVWSNALHTIQGAVDAASDGDTVLVTNGHL